MAKTPTHIYILGFSDGVIKVGRTANPDKRVAQHAYDARIRRATVTDTWVHATDRAGYAEHCLISCGRANLEHLVGEYFSGDFHTFLPVAVKWIQRVGLMPVDKLSFKEALERFDLTANQLICSREYEGLPLQYSMGEPMRGYFFTDEISEWATPDRLFSVREMYR